MRPFAVEADRLPAEGEGDRTAGELTWTTLISADRTPSAEMVVGVANFPPGGNLKPHRHAAAEFYFGLAGDGTVSADGREFAIARGTAVFIPGDTLHGVQAGANGLSFLYGFAVRAFSDIVYHYAGADVVYRVAGAE